MNIVPWARGRHRRSALGLAVDRRGDVAFRLGPLGGLYGGGGLAVLNRDGDGTAGTHAGVNVFAGLRLPGTRLPVRPFVEARWTFVEGESPFRLAAGVSVPLGGRSIRPPTRR